MGAKIAAAIAVCILGGACHFDATGAAFVAIDAGGGGPGCGNGIQEGAEQCDGVDLDNQTCQTLQHAGGELGCNPNCTVDESACTDVATD